MEKNGTIYNKDPNETIKQKILEYSTSIVIKNSHDFYVQYLIFIITQILSIKIQNQFPQNLTFQIDQANHIKFLSFQLHIIFLYIFFDIYIWNRKRGLQLLKKQSQYFQMGFFKRIRKMIEMTDFFNSTQMLRYENQNQYRTLTGGILSLGIIVTIIIGFASMILDTLNLTSITYTQNVITRQSPSSTAITASPDHNFMFGIEIWRQNLSNHQRYFDVNLQLFVENAGIANPVNLPLVQCTKDHWKSMPDVVGNFDKLQMSGWLCPPIGTEYQIVGKYTSDFYKQLIFTVGPCNNATDPNRPCASPQAIDQLFQDNGGWFYFTFYYINTIINPSQPTYKNYYLEDTAYLIFGQDMGIESYLYFADFDITTDYSIWPFSDVVEDDGFMTQSKPTSHPYSINAANNANYISFAVAKSANSLIYSRQVQKISTVFSFMGGLIGALMAGLFVINSYTSFAFEISIAMEVFKKQQQTITHKQQTPAKDTHLVNFIQFVQYYWYNILKFFKGVYKDNDLQHLYQCRKQILRQLDIKSLVKRLIFLEYSMTFIFSDYQLEGLQLHKPTHPLDVKAIRKRIENIDLAELQIQSNSSPSEAKINDLLEPKIQFNLGAFLSSAKVANLHSQADTNVALAKPIESRPSCNDIIVENISAISQSQLQRKQKFNLEKKKATRIKNLKESAKDGNQISKRIWNSIRQIEQANYLQ